ncbi:hypothetical protein Tco_0432836 [Tanacetum coccineum]
MFRELVRIAKAGPQDGPADAGSISQSVADALVEHEANKSKNGDDCHDSGTGSKRKERAARTDIYEKDEKRSQNDKTGHGMEKYGKDKAQV